MDKLEYLNHIAKSNRPVAPVKQSKISMALIGRILIGGIVATTLLIGISVLVTNSSNRSTDLTSQLYLRINNLNQTISTYSRSLKSSQLRSISVSLSGALTNTSNQLNAYAESLKQSDKDEPLAPNDKIAQAESLTTSNLNTSLNNAKLNGILDRTYAVQIHLQVSLLLSLASELASRASDDPTLMPILQQFQSSLTVIEESLDNYSNPSD